MTDQVQSRVNTMLEIMCLPDGTPLIPVDAIDRLVEMGFFTAPASTKYHLAYEGGLFDHSYNVTYALLELTKQCGIRWQRAASPYIVGMFHDLCKCDQYRHPQRDDLTLLAGEPMYDIKRWEHNPDTLLKGHGDKSVMLLSQFYKLTEEEIMCIRYHMGAFTEKEEWKGYTDAIHRYPAVLWTHTADMIAAHITEV